MNFSPRDTLKLGDHTDTKAVLMETGNPVQDKLHAGAKEALILTGKDEFFEKAADRGLYYVPYREKGLSMEERVGRHLAAILALVYVFSETHPAQAVEIASLPDYEDIIDQGVGRFLRAPSRPR